MHLYFSCDQVEYCSGCMTKKNLKNFKATLFYLKIRFLDLCFHYVLTRCFSGFVICNTCTCA